MTSKEIKEMYDAGNASWEILAAMVNDGDEFPDASAKVGAALRMKKDEIKDMEHDYDTIC